MYITCTWKADKGCDVYRRRLNLAFVISSASQCIKYRPNKQFTEHLEYADVVANALLLALCYALRDPCDVSDFLEVY